MGSFLITGVSGFLGSSLAERLLADGHRVLGVDVTPNTSTKRILSHDLRGSGVEEMFTYCEADLTVDDIGELLGGVDCLFHLAGNSDQRIDIDHFPRVLADNTIATSMLAKALARCDWPIRVVNASSWRVYGHYDLRLIDEHMRCGPRDIVGHTKFQAERILSGLDLPTVSVLSLRFFPLYGVGDAPGSLISRLISETFARGYLMAPRDLTLTRDLTYIDDAVSALICAAKSKYVGAVNVGGGPVAFLQLADLLEGAFACPIEVRSDKDHYLDFPTPIANVNSAKYNLGYIPTVRLVDGISRICADLTMRGTSDALSLAPSAS